LQILVTHLSCRREKIHILNFLIARGLDKGTSKTAVSGLCGYPLPELV
jgi:hypothetical protein